MILIGILINKPLQGCETRNVGKARASKKKECHGFSYFEKKVINFNSTDVITAILLLKLNYYCLYVLSG